MSSRRNGQSCGRYAVTISTELSRSGTHNRGLRTLGDVFFVMASRHALSCFFDVEAALKIDDKKPLETRSEVLQEMLASNIGKHLYKDEGFKEQLDDFEKSCRKRFMIWSWRTSQQPRSKVSKTP